MPEHPRLTEGQVLRHFTVAVFVVHESRVVLHFHPRLQRWLPPGGHVEDNELPDDAALREVEEETGLQVRLVGRRGLNVVTAPQQLVVPAGIQVENIYPGHQHIDLVYFAVPVGSIDIHERFSADRVGWHSVAALEELGADEEIRAWSERAIREVAR